MKLKSIHLGIALIVILFGGILISAALNHWNTLNVKTPATIRDGEFAGEYNPEDLRGSYSFREISDLFQIPLEDLQVAFALPQGTDAANFKIKDLETLFASLADSDIEIGTDSMRLFVSLYTELPYSLDEDIYLPQPAVDILSEQGNLTSEQLDYLHSHAVDVSGLSGDITSFEEQDQPVEAQTGTEDSSQSSGEEESGEDDTTVKGKTTFRDVLDLGVSEDTILQILGVSEMPNPLVTVKDYCLEQGLEFGTIKTELQAEIDLVAGQ